MLNAHKSFKHFALKVSEKKSSSMFVLEIRSSVKTIMLEHRWKIVWAFCIELQGLEKILLRIAFGETPKCQRHIFQTLLPKAPGDFFQSFFGWPRLLQYSASLHKKESNYKYFVTKGPKKMLRSMLESIFRKRLHRGAEDKPWKNVLERCKRGCCKACFSQRIRGVNSTHKHTHTRTHTRTHTHTHKHTHTNTNKHTQ